MADFNSISISGRLGADPDCRFNDSGMAILSFNLANGIYKKGAENNTHTTWYRCTIFGKRAETMNEMLAKGTKVIVQGTHSIRTYTDKEGNERQANEITVNDITLLGSRNDNAPQEADEAPRKAAPQQQDGARAIPTRRAIPANRPARNQPVAVDERGDDADLPF